MTPGTQMIQETLIEPSMVWARHGKFTLAGFERSTNQYKEKVECAQSWLCEIDLSSLGDGVVVTPRAPACTFR
jgi:hypothetical protein